MTTRLAVLLWLFCNWSILLAQDPAQESSPIEMLHVMQIDDSLLSQFVDDRNMVDEREPLLRLLFRLPAFSQVDLDRWTKTSPDWSEITDSPDTTRFEVLELRGRIQSIAKQTVIPELRQRLGYSQYFELTVSHDNRTSIVFVRDLTTQWTTALAKGIEIQEAVRIQGLLLKRNDRTLIFAAKHVGWFPDKPSIQLGVSSDQVMLSQIGVDVSRLANIQHRAGMKGGDREGFYQLMAAVHHSESSQFAKLGRREFEISRMIKTPKDVVGELYTLHGLARRAVRIEVDDADIRERFGIDHYWEIEVFLPMEKPVRFVDEQNAEGKVFNDYPFVVCVPELPANMETGDDIRAPFSFSGFFFKLWAYRTQFMEEMRTANAKPAMQLSPLLIGPTVELDLGPPPSESQISLIIACLFTASLLLIWFLLWRASIQDRIRAKWLFEKNLPPDASFKSLSND